MRKIAARFKQYGPDLYYCSSDTRSLDAVVIEQLGVIIVDGTAPHVFNADFPGIGQTIVDLGQSWDREKLKMSDEDIRRCFALNSRYHSRARQLITALSSVNDSIIADQNDNLNMEKIRLSAAVITKEIEKGENATLGYNHLSAITADGYATQPAQPTCVVRTIEDDAYAAGFALMEEIKQCLLKKGQQVVVSECILFSTRRIEHIQLPEKGIRFSLKNKLNHLPESTNVDCRSFYLENINDSELARQINLVRILEDEIAYSIKTALQIHDELESYYISALDFEKLDEIAEQIIAQISKNI